MKKELAVIGTGLGGLIVGHTIGAIRGLCVGADMVIKERQKAKKVQKILVAGTAIAGAIATAAINKNKELKDELMSRQGQ
jgi:hypothetical protein